MLGALCGDGTLCSAVDGGVACTPCTTDAACTAAKAGTLCYAGKCAVGSCHPGEASACTSGHVCCASTGSEGECLPYAGTPCCANGDCADGKTCNGVTHACECPFPEAGVVVASPKGHDESGNGSSACPFKTITKAIQSADARAATVVVLDAAGLTPAVFGDGCSGGPPCDATPILIASGGLGRFTIKGNSVPANVRVTGSGTAVFSTRRSGTSFESMTIAPTRSGLQANGGTGIEYLASSVLVDHGVRNVVLEGFGSGSDISFLGAGTGILVASDDNPTIGPGVTISSFYFGISVANFASPHITGSSSSPTRVQQAEGSAIQIAGEATVTKPVIVDSTGAGPGFLIENCQQGVNYNTPASIVGAKVSGLMILRDGGSIAPGATGIMVRRGSMSASDVQINGGFNYGVRVLPGATLKATDGSVIGSELGVFVQGRAELASFDVRSNKLDGLLCATGGSLKLRGSTFLVNGLSGVAVKCSADLGTDSDPGNNVFNQHSARNGSAGLCLLASGTYTASSSSFGCGHTGTGCTVATGTLSPSKGTSTADLCPADVDLAFPVGSTVSTPAAQCCN